MCAEWEPVEGVMIRWPLGISGALVPELAADDRLFVVIMSGQIPSATNTFTAYGVNMANVEWVPADSYSHWSRDWGPQCLFDGAGDWGILDPWFSGYPWIPREETGYEQDDDTPGEFAAHLGGEPLWQPPFYLTGGNIMHDGHGRAFCSEAQLSENDHLSENAFRAALLTWAGVRDLVRLQVDQLAALEPHRAGSHHVAHDGLDGSRATHAVAAQQRHDLALANAEIHAVQDMALAVPGFEAIHLKHGPPPAWRCPGRPSAPRHWRGCVRARRWRSPGRTPAPRCGRPDRTPRSCRAPR
jgi:hypothetical protein